MAIFTAIVGAIGAIGSFIGSLGVLGTALTQLAIGAALTLASTLLTPRPKASQLRFQNPSPQYQAVINQAAAPRRRGYGRVKAGGIRAFFDSKDGTLYQIVMLHSGEIDGYEEFWLGDVLVTLDGVAVTTAPFTGYATVNAQTGTDDQLAWDLLASRFTAWTSQHRLRGIANLRVTFKSPPADQISNVFPESYNTPVRAVFRASKILDTRTSVTAWSDNPAMILRDYLTHPDGYRRLTADDIDVASFNAFADLCDEAVPLAAGGSEKRYRAWGLYELNDDPTEVIGRILRACDGELYTTAEGKVAIRGGKWEPPTVTIDDAHIISHDLEEGADALDRFNQLKILYTSPLHDYQPTEAEPWDDLADQAERGVQPQDFSVDMCPSPAQARRLAKIFIAKANPRWRGTIRTDLAGLAARGERIITLRVPELQIETTFLVTSHNLLLEGGLPIGCEIGVSSLDASAYEWTTAEEGTNPVVPVDTRPLDGLPTPENLTLAVESRQATEATVVAVVTAEVDTPTRPELGFEAQIRLSSLSLWEPMAVASGQFDAVSGALIDGEEYAVRARFTTAGAVGPWTAEATITVVTNTTAPAAPTAFSATLNGSDVDLAWTNPSTNFYRARVYRGTTSVFADATQIAELAGTPGLASAYTDVAPGAATTFYYWITARNESGVEGAAAGPQSVTTP
jgi:hypothetical protein